MQSNLVITDKEIRPLNLSDIQALKLNFRCYSFLFTFNALLNKNLCVSAAIQFSATLKVGNHVCKFFKVKPDTI